MARRNPRGSVRPEAASGYDRLWAPWRSSYVSAAQKRSQECIFCFGKLGEASLHRRLVLYAGPDALVMLNRYPYNNGHLMVAPRRHVSSLELMSREERTVISELIAASVARLRQAMKPDGLNVGANLGRSAGAGIADHLHWHIVPRWNGDANFMPVISSTRVISQHLEDSFALLQPLFKAIGTAIS